MKSITHVLLIIGLLVTGSAGMAAEPQCSKQAIEQAGKLLAFHFGEDDRIAIDHAVNELPSIRNPANSEQQFQVLEVWGHIYKGKYRMRLLYYPLDNSCLLMGQEILEFADL